MRSQEAPCTLGLLSSFYVSGLTSSVHGQSFEAASVKPWTPEVKQPYTISGGPGTNDPGRFYAPHISMATLLTRAFDIQIDQIEGPAWLRDVSSGSYFTVMAKVPAGAMKEEFGKMLQNLLAERFHLKLHIEKRDFPGYELVVDKSGTKLKEVVPAQDAKQGELTAREIIDSAKGDDGFPKVSGPRTMAKPLATAPSAPNIRSER